jgi:hypothetical protein
MVPEKSISFALLQAAHQSHPQHHIHTQQSILERVPIRRMGKTVFPRAVMQLTIYHKIRTTLQTTSLSPATLKVPRNIKTSTGNSQRLTIALEITASAAYPPSGTYGPPQQFFPQHQAFRSEIGGPSATQTSMSSFRGYVQDQNSLTRMAVVGGQPQGMFTRNLIGSLAASAFRLADTSERMGIWFVLQDLSVRTEGPFR